MKKFIFVVSVIGLLASGIAFASISGCTNPKAINYNSLATNDDGSCRMPNGNPLVAVQVGLNGYTGHQIVSNGWTLKPGEGGCPKWYVDRGQGACWYVPVSAPKLELPAWYVTWLSRR